MFIRHYLPTEGYTKIDRKVFTDSSLSDGAVRLYGYLCSLRNGSDFTDNYLIKALGISKDTLARRKRELKERGLILVEEIRPRCYVIYIGYIGYCAEQVKKQWESESV